MGSYHTGNRKHIFGRIAPGEGAFVLSVYTTDLSSRNLRDASYCETWPEKATSLEITEIQTQHEELPRGLPTQSRKPDSTQGPTWLVRVYRLVSTILHLETLKCREVIFL